MSAKDAVSRAPDIAVPTMGLDPEDATKVLPGLEACKSPNPSSLKNGCLGTAPSIGMDQFGLWCASGSTTSPTSISQPSRPRLPPPTHAH